MRKLLTAALTAAAFVVPFTIAAPAHASYTLCDDETNDQFVRVGGNTIGVDLVDPNSDAKFVCVQQVHVGVRTTGGFVLVACTYFTADGNSADDVCFVL